MRVGPRDAPAAAIAPFDGAPSALTAPPRPARRRPLAPSSSVSAALEAQASRLAAMRRSLERCAPLRELPTLTMSAGSLTALTAPAPTAAAAAPAAAAPLAMFNIPAIPEDVLVGPKGALPLPL